jgi:2-polyprenyl-3-methyl-5-hydroxy-6-metoxy-1,4-benzoquinol methylase
MNFEARPSLSQLVSRQLDIWPEHVRAVAASFRDRPADVLGVSDSLSAAILSLAEQADGGLDGLCRDYRFMCESIVLPEEIYFRRHGHYRLSLFADANAECYADETLMAKYMNGLLISNVMWDNHARAFAHFATDYLGRLAPGSRHLEIGPGHGLYLLFAARCPQVASIAGWDVSPTSIEKTRLALQTLRSPLEPELHLQNLFDAAPTAQAHLYDSLVISEVLEHLEDPVAALRAAAKVLKPGGAMFVNVPANSPAPDHIFLFEDSAHAERIVREAGLEVIDSQAFPMSGTTLARAVKLKLAVSCVVTARRPTLA